MQARQNKKQGFTLIEMIVSLAVFSFVATIAVGALLMLIGTNKQLQDEQSVMTNLSFALDSMTREIRTGTRYYCGSSPSVNTEIVSGRPYLIFKDDSVLTDHPQNPMEFSSRDCENGNDSNHRFQGLAFIEGGKSVTGTEGNRIVYFFDAGSPSDPNDGQIMRRIDGEEARSIVSSGIDIINAEFFVTGTETLRGVNDTRQPQVTIFIEAIEDGGNPDTDKTYQIQTSVTQRAIDI